MRRSRDPIGGAVGGKANRMLSRFRSRFWLPPRAHGDLIENRTISFLELFYDLVFVVVIARAAKTLAEDVTWRKSGEFAVVFGLIWIAWLRATLYYDLHGREDGRTRVFVFLQMTLLGPSVGERRRAVSHKDGDTCCQLESNEDSECGWLAASVLG